MLLLAEPAKGSQYYCGKTPNLTGNGENTPSPSLRRCKKPESRSPGPSICSRAQANIFIACLLVALLSCPSIRSGHATFLYSSHISKSVLDLCDQLLHLATLADPIHYRRQPATQSGTARLRICAIQEA